jgi:RES domain-containing protein
MILYRLGSRKYPSNDGSGASSYGGRWNHKGTQVIYAAESHALCALEVLAGSAQLGHDYVFTRIEVPDGLSIEEITVADLPSDWNAPEPVDATRTLGTAWANSLTTAVLCVPSAVIPREHNYLLNPLPGLRAHRILGLRAVLLR